MSEALELERGLDVLGVEVALSEDAGGYYCAHLLFLADEGGAACGSSVLQNAEGERLVGFLHVPRDAESTGGAPRRPPAERHRETRLVVAAGLRGYAEEVWARGERCARVLLTGFGRFCDVVDNPTGDFVRERENLVESLRLGFSDLAPLLPREPVRVLEGERAVARVFRADLDGGRALELGAAVLPVDDDAIDPGRDDSIQGMLRRFAPHALFAMGVGHAGPFCVEVRPSAKGLRLDGGRPVHEAGFDGGRSMPRNASLWRAIERGAQIVRP